MLHYKQVFEKREFLIDFQHHERSLTLKDKESRGMLPEKQGRKGTSTKPRTPKSRGEKASFFRGGPEKQGRKGRKERKEPRKAGEKRQIKVILAPKSRGEKAT